MAGCRSRPGGSSRHPMLSAFSGSRESLEAGKLKYESSIFRYRFPVLSGRNLYLWCNSGAIDRRQSPPMTYHASCCQPRPRAYRVLNFPAASATPCVWGNSRAICWQRAGCRFASHFLNFVRVRFISFDSSFVQSVLFLQRWSDGVPHTMILDEIRFDDDAEGIAGSAGSLPALQNVKAIGYDRHVEVHWEPVSDPALIGM